MKIIISPAKKMIENFDDFNVLSSPILLNKTKELLDDIKSLDYETLKKIWKCNDKIAKENYERFQTMDLNKNLTPAILSYDGIQFKYMAPHIFNNDELKYIQNNLRILSGFYGVLAPFDGIVPYRLEMQAKMPNYDLYNFWKDSIYKALDDDFIINLASKEYSKAISPYLNKPMIDIVFGEIIDNKIKTKGTLAKMARGNMIAYLAAYNVNTIEGIKAFNDGYIFSEKYSTENKLVFLKGNDF